MDPTLEGVLTVAGAAPIVTILTGVALKTLGPNFDAGRFGPLIALVFGVLVALIGVFGLGLLDSANIALALLTGITAGAAGIGVFETLNGTVLGK